MLHVTGDRWHVTHDTRQVTHDMWQTKFFCKKNKQFLNLNGISATNDTRQEICCHPYVPYVSIQFLQYFEQKEILLPGTQETLTGTQEVLPGKQDILSSTQETPK